MAVQAPTLRFGIAGVAASMSEARAIAKHPNLTITASAARTRESLNRFTAEFPCDTYQDIEAMFASPNVDAVFIGTPTQLHTEHAVTALEHGKHVIVSKPMAITLDDADRMIQAAERSRVQLVVGHSQGFETPVHKIREIVASGELGPLRMINTWYYTDWIYRGRAPEELDTSKGGGVVYRQAAHQFDILRLIGGGLVRSVRAMTGVWDSEHPTEGAYLAFLDFEGGAAASAVFNGYDHFRTTELGFPIGEGGQRVREEGYAAARIALRASGEEAQKAAHRFGRQGERSEAERFHSFYGLTVVSCERGDIRQSPDGLLVYGETEKREVVLPKGVTGRDVMVDELYQAVAHDKPPLHSGRWAKATLEVCLAVLQSSRERREVQLQHQVPTPD